MITVLKSSTAEKFSVGALVDFLNVSYDVLYFAS